MRADLHVHTLYSDGDATVKETVRRAAENGVKLLSVTDHDTLKASAELKKECALHAITPVVGAEISAYENSVKLHILFYNPTKNFTQLNEFFNKLKLGSVKRAEDIVYKLNKCGVSVTIDEVAAQRFCEDTPIHSMHIARVCAKKGYASTPFGFYEKYLALGKEAFSTVCRPNYKDTLEIINCCGGISSLAHPARIDMPQGELLKLINKMKLCGLCGIEAVYSSHTFNETAYYKEIAKQTKLLITGGSDAHFKDGAKKIGFPEFEVDGTLLQRLTK